jgi:hypothetical protein
MASTVRGVGFRVESAAPTPTPMAKIAPKIASLTPVLVLLLDEVFTEVVERVRLTIAIVFSC